MSAEITLNRLTLSFLSVVDNSSTLLLFKTYWWLNLLEYITVYNIIFCNNIQCE